MLDRTKKALVSSFVGAIGLGYILGEAVLYFAAIFTAPLTRWTTQQLYPGLTSSAAKTVGFPLQAAVPDLVGFLVIMLVWYGLFRWLYCAPVSSANTPGTDSHSGA